MNLKFSLIFFILVFYEGIEGGLVTLKEPPQVLNGQIQHVLTSDNTGGVEYGNIPVYGRKMSNGFEMGKSGGDKEVGESKGEQGKEKEEENCNQNCEEVVCEDEDEIGERIEAHGFNGGKQLKCELGEDKFYKCTNIMGDYPKEVHSKGFNRGEYQLECPIGPNGSNMEVAKANATQVEGEKRNWFVQFILDPIKNVTSGWNNTKV
uniref:Uncharacterized protein n=1 Tax=Meloidogyne javanica TaxID=6303 RepID=A0A915MAA7_MELJA